MDDDRREIPPRIFFHILDAEQLENNFEGAVSKLIGLGADINYIDGNYTVLDVARGMAKYHPKVPILERYGAKTASEMGYVPPNLGDAIFEPFSAEMNGPVSTVQFDNPMEGKLVNVEDFLRESSSEGKEEVPGVISVHEQIVACRDFVGLLTASEDAIGTAFLISPELVIVSRHCLNEILLEELEVKFTALELTLQVVALIEDGAVNNLDYAILRLDGRVENIYVPALSLNRAPSLATFIGYSNEELHFTNFTPTSGKNEPIGSHQDAYQESNFGISGSPYLDEMDDVYAIHQNTGYNKKESLYIAHILEANSHSILQFMIAGYPFLKPISLSGPFSLFQGSEDSQFDENRDRGITLGKNPSVTRDNLWGEKKDKNIVCREVLFRWATKKVPKAKYIGSKTDPKKWIKDSGNWEVLVRKKNSAERVAVKLDPSTIQMGHKISALSYWVHGCDLVNNVILSDFFKDYKGKTPKDAKIARYTQRYSDYTKPGFRVLQEGPNGLKNRMFMFDHRNYRFEWGSLNMANGKAEGEILAFTDVTKQDATFEVSSKNCRGLRKDRKTTPIIGADLDKRKGELAQKIEAESARFQKGPFKK